MTNDRVYVMRQSIVKLAQMLAGKGITVTQQGITAYVRSDASGRPVLVNLPYMPDNATEELIQAIQGFLDHEVAHILFSDFSLMSKAGGHKSPVGNMLNIIEDTRIERLMTERFEGSAYNLGKTGKFFLDKYTVPKMHEAIAEGDNDKLMAVLTVPLVRAMAGQLVFKDFMKDHMGVVAPIYDKIKDLESRIAKATTCQDALDLAREVIKRLRGEEDEGSGGKGAGRAKAKAAAGGKGGKEKGKEDDDDAKGKGKAAKPPKGGKPEPKEEEGGAGDDDEKDETEGAAGGGAGDEEKPEPEPDEEEGAPEPKPEADEDDEDEPEPEPDADEEETPEEILADESDDGDIEVEDDPLVPPEAKKGESDADDESEMDSAEKAPLNYAAIEKELANDYDETVSKAITDSSAEAAESAEYLVFTTDKDVIEPLRIGSGYKDKMLTDLMDKCDHMVAPLQKDLERAISARSLAIYSTGHRSGRLHPANLARLAVVTPAGHDDRVFRRKHETTSKDVAVELVIDASGSMGGAKIHTATQAAYCLSSTLERIGIKNEVICFTTGEAVAPHSTLHAEAAKIGRSYSRYESLYMPILKGFEERLTSETKKRFGWLPNSSIMSQNVDGECVEIAARRLMGRRETGKVLIVLSDGYPAASGGGATLNAHLKKVVKRLTGTGMSVVGIGIQSEAVKQFYPKNVVIQSVTELPTIVMKELRNLIIH